MTGNKTSAPSSMPVWFGPLMVLGGGICIGFAPIGLRLGLEELGPQAIAFWRYLFALPILFVLAVGVNRRLPARPNPYIVIAGVCFALDIGLWHWSLTYTTVANATFIVGLGNVCVGLMAWIFLRERPTLIWGCAVLVAIIGAAALSLGGNAGGQTDIRGDMLALAAAVLVSGYMVASKVARNRLGGLDAVFWLTLVEVGVAALMVIGFRESFLPATLMGFAAPLFLAIAVQVGGQGLIITGLGHTPAAIAGVLLLVQPIVAASISWQLFGETLTALQAGGAALILLGIYLSQQKFRSREEKMPDQAAKPLSD
ncbi:DMT family transporter [Hyphomonas sp. FCG-A18]|uniref:DMT family transporter n=1 Tax=Hyphomonas sp. FCG-A18 TaxID=3080019 RepID=UPI002B2F8FAC|nr:DMT family transporter [Hyphomonas sp. FCG-A18]